MVRVSPSSSSTAIKGGDPLLHFLHQLFTPTLSLHSLSLYSGQERPDEVPTSLRQRTQGSGSSVRVRVCSREVYEVSSVIGRLTARNRRGTTRLGNKKQETESGRKGTSVIPVCGIYVNRKGLARSDQMKALHIGGRIKLKMLEISVFSLCYDNEMAGKSFLLRAIGMSRSSSKKSSSSNNNTEEGERSVQPRGSHSPDASGYYTHIPSPARAMNEPQQEPEPQPRRARTRLAAKKTFRRGHVERFILTEADWAAIREAENANDNGEDEEDEEEPEEQHEEEPEEHHSPIFIMTDSERARIRAEMESDNEGEERNEYGEEPAEDGDETGGEVDHHHRPEESIPMDYEYSDQPSRGKGKKKIKELSSAKSRAITIPKRDPYLAPYDYKQRERDELAEAMRRSHHEYYRQAHAAPAYPHPSMYPPVPTYPQPPMYSQPPPMYPSPPMYQSPPMSYAHPYPMYPSPPSYTPYPYSPPSYAHPVYPPPNYQSPYPYLPEPGRSSMGGGSSSHHYSLDPPRRSTEDARAMERYRVPLEGDEQKYKDDEKEEYWRKFFG
ncbi:hypothetical protein QVD17_10259 [Tagetes erecta]|uniref:Uncharacterized protein n=1 Tax=Tagetes erecta TaxID=13708 RepID=A0AAD8L0R3_TARER|nr:hypothetical protein QVD17_10259 [Tagetes erecta]